MTSPGPGNESGLKSRGNAWLVVLPVLLFGGLAAWLYWPLGPVDDAFITFRYADNVAAGLGPVFNPGERVEGYSSPLWLALLSAGAVSGLPLEPLSKLLGLLAALGAMGVVAGAARTRMARGTALLLLAVSSPFLYHSLNGLETSLAALLFAIVALSDGARRRSGWLVPLAAAALVLTRPEGLAMVLAMGVASALVRGGAGLALRPMVAAVATFGVMSVARFAWYGEWIANSARAKLLPLSFALPGGLADLARFLWEGNASGLVVGFSVVAGVAAWRGGDREGGAETEEDRLAVRERTLLVPAVALLLAVGGGDSFPLWRFLVPMLPLLALLAGEGVELAAGAAAALGWNRRVAAGVLGAAAVANLLVPLPGYLEAARSQAEWVRRWTLIGRALAAQSPPGTTVALCPVGVIPRISGLRTIDMLGLTNRDIARVPPDRSFFYPGHQRHDAGIVLGASPDLILLANGPIVATPGEDFPWSKVRPYEVDVARHPAFLRDYALTHWPIDGGGWVKIFAKKSLLGGAAAAARPPAPPAR